MKATDIIREDEIFHILEKTKNPSRRDVHLVLNKALRKKGLSLYDAGILVNNTDRELIEAMFCVSSEIKKDIYGERLVFFAPLYISNYCVNDCEYCAFHSRNKADRKKLSLEEIKIQTKFLIDMGHKRLLLEFGEDPKRNPIDYVVSAIRAVYETKSGKGEIRRVNVNISATSVEDYQKLKEAGIGTYQLFQETYHKETYNKYHKGPKADYERQLFAHDRAFAGGIDDVGLGVLFGLYDWKFEVLALLSHCHYLDTKYGVGPHTISIPRLRPADTVNFNAPYAVNENEILKIISILRMAVPYTGMIISTRESAELREKAFSLGVSQASAGSCTTPGGYGSAHAMGQFRVNDSRSISEIIEGVLKQGLLPSFCTACYRKGRTGHEFMDLAKPGDIHKLCRPNAILTFKEYLEDYASDNVKKLGGKVIEKYLGQIHNAKLSQETMEKLKKMEGGERDLFF